MTESPLNSVAILLTTYNGERFLEQQLDSIAKQSHAQWKLYVSDDGSSDGTRSILLRFQKKHGMDRMKIFSGPQNGFAQNFLFLVRNSEVHGDYFAFCDQDDVWHENKLERSIAALANTPRLQPAMYCSRTRLTNEAGMATGFSPLFSKPPGFRNALVQSLAGANTMLINPAARELMASTPKAISVVSHDWLAYLLISGCGGAVIYDPVPTLDYRQHEKNLIGSNSNIIDRFKRLKEMLKGTFSEWNHLNIIALEHCKNQLKRENLKALTHFENARKASLPQRLVLLKKSGVYRQTKSDNFGLLVAAALRKI